MAKNDYRRSLVMLRGLEKGYGGHARLERRVLTGTLDFNVTAPTPNEALAAVLVGPRGGRLTAKAMGNLKSDGRGQRALLAAFDPRNIAGVDLNDMTAAVIARVNGARVTPVLCGWLNGAKALNWAEVERLLENLFAQAPQSAYGSPGENARAPEADQAPEESGAPDAAESPGALFNANDAPPAEAGGNARTERGGSANLSAGSEAGGNTDENANPGAGSTRSNTGDSASADENNSGAGGAGSNTDNRANPGTGNADSNTDNSASPGAGDTGSNTGNSASSGASSNRSDAGGGNTNADGGGSNTGGGGSNTGGGNTGSSNAGGGNPGAGNGSTNADGGNTGMGSGSSNADGSNTGMSSGSSNAGSGSTGMSSGSSNAGGGNTDTGNGSSNAGGGSSNAGGGNTDTGNGGSGADSGENRAEKSRQCPAGAYLDLDMSAPWPEDIESLRILFLTLPRYEPFAREDYVFVRACMAEETGIDHCAVGVRAENGAVTGVCYAIPMAYTPTPPAGLEGYEWIGDQNKGWWVTCDDLGEDA